MARRKTIKSAEVAEAEARNTKRIAGYSAAELTEKLTPYVDGSIATLGQAAVEGDKAAAKTVLELLTELARDNTGTAENPVLEQIAKIRGNTSST